MTRTTSGRRWNDVKDQAHLRWGRLTGHELEIVRGNIDRLVDALQRCYGYDRRRAEREVEQWRETLVRASAV
jgi:uncharacterized protein YjbJ (UPF0337 family)